MNPVAVLLAVTWVAICLIVFINWSLGHLAADVVRGDDG